MLANVKKESEALTQSVLSVQNITASIAALENLQTKLRACAGSTVMFYIVHKTECAECSLQAVLKTVYAT